MSTITLFLTIMEFHRSPLFHLKSTEYNPYGKESLRYYLAPEPVLAIISASITLRKQIRDAVGPPQILRHWQSGIPHTHRR